MAFTFFFRDHHVLEHAVRLVVPAITGRNRPRIWDAGCATGQEAYTLAIMFAERMGQFAFNNLRIDATDLDGESGTFGQVVTRGEYLREELDRLPPEIRQRHFEPAAPGWFRVAERLRTAVRFQRHDLLSLEPIATGYSLIVCKNVLLHLAPAARADVVRMFHEALAPGGFFVTEQTQKLPAGTAHLFDQVAPDGHVFRRVEAQPAEAAA